MSQYFGHTLLELLVALALCALLASMAYPSYVSEMTHANRHRAEMVLMQLAARMEVYASQHNNHYEGATPIALQAVALLDNSNYQFEIATLGADHFILRAIPIKKQAVDDLQCGTLTLSDANVLGILGRGRKADCWHD